ILSGYLFHLHMGDHGDLFMVERHFCGSRGAGKPITADKNGHMPRVLGQKHAFFCGCKTAAHHKDFFSCKKLSVTGGTVSDAPPLELCLSGKSHAGGWAPVARSTPKQCSSPRLV